MKGKIGKFLVTLRAKSTKSTYRAGIQDFLNFIYSPGPEEGQRDYDILAERYLSEKRDYCQDVIEYMDRNENRPPRTISVYLAGWKEFLYFNDIDFSLKERRMMKRKAQKPRTVTEDTTITPEILYKLCDHTNWMGKTLFLFLSSSGCRIGEALTLDLDDIDWSCKPVKIMIRGDNTKNQEDRFTFITSETADYLKQWLSEREQYLYSSMDRHKGLIDHGIANPKSDPKDETRVFPFSSNTAYWIWDSAVDKAGLRKISKRTKRRTMTFHSLRRYFLSRLTGHMDEAIIELLIGHKGYLKDAYLRKTPEQIGDEYLRIEDVLQMSSVENISTRLKTLESENNKLKKKIHELTSIIQYWRSPDGFDLEEKYGYKQSLQDDLEKLKD